MVLPDGQGSEKLATALLEKGDRDVISHASGRPWIIGRWSAGDVVWTELGSSRVALFGRASVGQDELRRRVARVRELRDLDDLCRTVPGSYHLIASVDGRVRAQGSLSTARQISYAAVGAVTVAADRPQTLADLNGAGIEEELVAARLIGPWTPWPLSERSLWQGVRSLPLGTFLELTPRGGHRTVRWWTVPHPDVPLREGAQRLRDALDQAIAARARGGDTLSADLSGGMDSTSLCFLAARHATHLVTTRWEAEDDADEDQVWARLAARRLPAAEHLLLPRRSAPGWFTAVHDQGEDTEGPFAWVRTRARLGYLADHVAAHGSATHVTGHGGDELFFTTPLYLHTLARTHPLGSVGLFRAHRAMHRWRLWPALAALADSSSFGQWLTASADGLTAPMREFRGRAEFGWGIGYRLPPWATPAAVDAARGLLRDTAAQGPAPLSRLRGQHAALQDIRLCGDTIRRVDRFTRAAHGVSWEAPFADDAVIEAALSLRFADIARPDAYKPALAAAMRGTVPAEVLARPTKSEYSSEAYAGLRANRAALLDLCNDMELERRGLVDPDALRAVLVNPPVSSFSLMPLISTFACEAWLRSLRHRTGHPALAGERT